MNRQTKKKLEARGWRVGSTSAFLKLSPHEARFIEMKRALSRELRVRRLRRKLTQEELARSLHSSQSRVAKMEACDPSVSFDLLVRALLSLGATPRELARVLAAAGRRRAA